MTIFRNENWYVRLYVCGRREVKEKLAKKSFHKLIKKMLKEKLFSNPFISGHEKRVLAAGCSQCMTRVTNLH